MTNSLFMLNRRSIQHLRKKHIAPSFSISYDKPLHIVFGKGQYLYDSSGNKFLDAVNNIQHIGHSHPKVTEAIARQSKKLNVNTRYLDATIVKYAKDLTQKFPKGLEVCYFTNSGSESNDLALRIARTLSKSKETIVLDGAYHGHTSALIEVSPYKFNGLGGSGCPNFVHVISRPDPYRGRYTGQDCFKDYLIELDNVLNTIKIENRGVASFIVEPIMGCGGQIVFPSGFLRKAFKLIRESGGICIADEVQIGFGRMGTYYWGFETENVVPDIITVGKSMGNGYPLSAVVTTKEIADKFNNGMEYFNSFGGNPVSCAVGRSVLKVIKEERLQENAQKTGSYLIRLLEDLKKEHAIIGDVRGRGLFIGIELVRDETSKEPANIESKQLINKIKDKGVLLSVDGPFNNVIKIKPPLVFNEENAKFLVGKLSKTLQEIKEQV